MKLLMITGDRAVASGKRGPFADTLAGLAAEFAQIDVLCPYVAEPAWKEIVPQNVHVHIGPRGWVAHARWVRTHGALLRAQFGHSVATVHASPPFHHAIGAYLLRKKTGIRTALEVHHLVGFPSPADTTERIAYWLSRFLLPFLGRRSDSVRVVNKGMAALLTGWRIPAAKIRVVPSFYLKVPDPSTLENVSPGSDLLFCARLVPNKNLPLILKALQLLPGVTLTVVGDGPKRAEWEALAKTLGVASRVTFRGWLAGPLDVYRAMHAAKVFVQPSLSEGGPRVALEAMMLGVPVVSTKVGVMPDVIVHNRNGFLVDATPEAFAEAIKPLLAGSAIRERIGGEATAILTQFEYQKTIGQYARFLQLLA